jgi:hypothetical protein
LKNSSNHDYEYRKKRHLNHSNGVFIRNSNDIVSSVLEVSFPTKVLLLCKHWPFSTDIYLSRQWWILENDYWHVDNNITFLVGVYLAYKHWPRIQKDINWLNWYFEKQLLTCHDSLTVFKSSVDISVLVFIIDL